MLSDTNIPPYFIFGFEMPQMMPIGAMENGMYLTPNPAVVVIHGNCVSLHFLFIDSRVLVSHGHCNNGILSGYCTRVRCGRDARWYV